MTGVWLTMEDKYIPSINLFSMAIYAIIKASRPMLVGTHIHYQFGGLPQELGVLRHNISDHHFHLTLSPESYPSPG